MFVVLCRCGVTYYRYSTLLLILEGYLIVGEKDLLMEKSKFLKQQFMDKMLLVKMGSESIFTIL
jgi:hypothetical protein